MSVKNYQILRRNEENFASAVFSGEVPEDIDPGNKICGRTTALTGQQAMWK